VADLALDPATGDIDLTAQKLHLVDGDDAIVQHVALRLRMFRGEWFLDSTVGMPYYERVLVKNPDLVAVRSAFRQAIASTPGIASIDKFDLALDSTIRKLTVTFTATKQEGGTLDFTREFVIA
jgi:hypothetical protein